MKKKEYVTPFVEIVNINIKQTILAGSGPNNVNDVLGTGDPLSPELLVDEDF